MLVIMSIIRSSRNPRLPQLQPLSARYKKTVNVYVLLSLYPCRTTVLCHLALKDRDLRLQDEDHELS